MLTRARRLPRRHLRRDERVRPGRRDAPAFPACSPEQVLRPPAAGRRSTPTSTRLGRVGSASAASTPSTPTSWPAIIVEPVLQGAGGMHVYDPDCLRVLREVADEHGLLLVFDEIATGFGRTGTLFAADAAGVVPDVMCVGKALTGGYLTLAAMLCTARGRPTASAARELRRPACTGRPSWPTRWPARSRCASLDLLATAAGRHDVGRIEAGLRAGLAPARGLDRVADVRVLGAVGVVQLDHPVDVAAVDGRGARAGRLGAPVPRPRLHDAAVRHRRRRRGRDLRRHRRAAAGARLTLR